MIGSGQAVAVHATASPAWRTSGIVARLLLISYLFITFIGFDALSVTSNADRVAGSPLNRTVILLLAALSMVVILICRAAVAALLRQSWLLVAIVGICQLSAAWAVYPDISLRRAVLLVCLTMIGGGIAAGVRDIRRFHTWLFIAMGIVVALNLAAVVLWPALAVSDIGVKGLYPQKNVAGSVAMIATIVGVTWTTRARSPAAVMSGLVMIGTTLIFLVLTQSKTSIALTALTLSVGALFAMAQVLGPRFIIPVAAVASFGIAVSFGVLAAYDFELQQILGLFLTDTSFTGRDELWSFAWNSALQRPWLGYGYGSFWDVGTVNDPLARLEPGTWLGDVDKGVINQAHNGYLELMLHVGIPTTVLAVAYTVGRMWAAMRTAVRPATPADAKAAYAAIALVLLAYLLHNLTEASLFMRGIPFFNLVLLLGLLAAPSSPVAPVTGAFDPEDII